jgi:hypothetical protein
MDENSPDIHTEKLLTTGEDDEAQALSAAEHHHDTVAGDRKWDYHCS